MPLVLEREAFINAIGPFSDAWSSATIVHELESSMSRDDAMLLLPEVIAEEIITRAQLKRVGRQIFDTIRINSSSYSMLREETFEAKVVPEGAEIPIATTTYDKLNVTPYKIGIRPHLTREMIADAQWDVMRRQIRNATDAMTRKEDTDIMAAALAGVPDGSTIVGYRVPDHIIGPTDYGGSSGDALTMKGIANALKILDQEEVVANIGIMNPVQKRDLFTMAEFQSSSVFQAAPQRLNELIATGWVANWFGINWYISNKIAAGTVLLLDTTKYGAIFERTPLTIENYTDVIRQMEGTAFSERYVPAVIVNEAAVIINDLKTT